MARIWKIFQSHSMCIGVWWLVNWAVTAVIVGLGDFGLPLWITPFCVVWAFTAGLPTLLSIVATTLITTMFSGFIPAAGLLLCVAALSLMAHFIAFTLLIRWKKNWRTR